MLSAQQHEAHNPQCSLAEAGRLTKRGREKETVRQASSRLTCRQRRASWGSAGVERELLVSFNPLPFLPSPKHPASSLTPHLVPGASGDRTRRSDHWGQ